MDHSLSGRLDEAYRSFFLFLVSGMNPSCTMSFSSLFYKSSCFFLIFNIWVSSAVSYSSSTRPGNTISYTDHCSSIVPESSPTHLTDDVLLPYFNTSYYTGGDRFFDKKPFNQSYYYVGKFLVLRFTSHVYETVAEGVYKVEAYLNIQSPYRYYNNDRRNFTYDGSYYHRRTPRRQRPLRFSLNGFWSNSLRKLCMVGSASWNFEQDKPVNLDAVLKLNHEKVNPNIFTSVVSGTLESISSAKDSGYFEPISMFGFPSVSNYNYSLVTEELKRGFSGDFEASKEQFLSFPSSQFCSGLLDRFAYFDLEYGTECKTHHNCSALGGVDAFLSRLVSLYPLQCSMDERKLRYLVRFQNVSYVAFGDAFDLKSTFIGEGSWDDKNNQLFIVICRILDPVNQFGNAVGDCTLRLSLRYPAVLTIRNDAKIVGMIWTNRTAGDSGYFKRINLTDYGGNDALSLPGLKYEYTELDRVKKLCPVKKVGKKKNTYPDGHSYSMRFDMSVENSKGKKFAWGYTEPLSVGNELFQRNQWIVLGPVSSPDSDIPEVATLAEPEKTTTAPLNISFAIFISPYHEAKLDNWYPTTNWSLNGGRMEITAEGVYYAETGHLCMVGCRKFTNNSRDCEILVNFDFAPLNDKRGGFIKGSIKSTRRTKDPLCFEEMSISSAAFYDGAAKESIWRMDLEITMVLIANTLVCIFVALQLFHVKRNPEVVSSISLVMLLILSLGQMIPLVLNFEALLLENRNRQLERFSSGGWLEANEVTIRVVTMVAFLLQIRLLQLVWTAKKSDGNEKGLWVGEKKAVFISLPMYILGGLLTLLLNWTRNKYAKPTVDLYGIYKKYSLWRDLRSFGGLILDGFLLPQILLNTFHGSAEKALSHPFYVGTSAVRLVPHAYNQYRAHNFPTSNVNGTYYYANPTADFYSIAWDIIIPCGVIALAVIVFLQQRHGGRCILPKRFRELELYEKVPVVNNEL